MKIKYILLAALLLVISACAERDFDAESHDDVVETTTVGRDDLGTPATTPIETTAPVLAQPGEAGTPPEATPATRRVRRTTAPVVIISPPETSLTAESYGVGTPTEALRPEVTPAITEPPATVPPIVIDSLRALKVEIDETKGEIRYYSKFDARAMSFEYNVFGANVSGNSMRALGDMDATIASVFNKEEGMLVGSFIHKDAADGAFIPAGTLVLTQRFTGNAKSLRFNEIAASFVSRFDARSIYINQREMLTASDMIYFKNGFKGYQELYENMNSLDEAHMMYYLSVNNFFRKKSSDRGLHTMDDVKALIASMGEVYVPLLDKKTLLSAPLGFTTGLGEPERASFSFYTAGETSSGVDFRLLGSKSGDFARYAGDGVQYHLISSTDNSMTFVIAIEGTFIEATVYRAGLSPSRTFNPWDILPPQLTQKTAMDELLRYEILPMNSLPSQAVEYIAPSYAPPPADRSIRLQQPPTVWK